jgi:uncharacterized membrane protein
MAYTHAAVFFPWRDGHLLHAPLSPLQSFLVDHFAPSLLIPGAFFQFFHSSELVLLFQELCVAGGTALLLRFGPLEERPRKAAFAVFLLFCSRAIFREAIDFREDHFAFFALSMVLLGLYRRNAWVFFPALLVYLGCKEHTPLVALGVLFPILWQGGNDQFSISKRRIWAIATLGLILGYGVLIYLKIIPALQAPLGQSIGQINQRLGHLGVSISEIALSPFLKPGIFWPWLLKRMGSLSSLRYLVFLLLPFAVFFWRAPVWVLAAAVGIFGNLIPERPEQRSFHWHYELAFAPFLIMGLLDGLRNFRPTRQLKWALVLGLVLSLKWPAAGVAQRNWTITSIRDSLALRRLPCESIALGANSATVSQLAHCPQIRWMKPGDCSNPAAWWQVLRSDPGPAGMPGESIRDATALVLDWSVECDAALGTFLKSQGAQISWTSPSGRFQRLEGFGKAD